METVEDCCEEDVVEGCEDGGVLCSLRTERRLIFIFFDKQWFGLGLV